MPNYSLVINSKFKPYTFKDMLEPLQLYKEAYKEQRETLSNLDLQNIELGTMINKDIDPELYDQYIRYNNELNNLTSDFYSNGASSNVLHSSHELNRMFNKDVFPIKAAYARKKEQLNSQLNEKEKDHSLIFSRDADLTPIKDYMDNPDLKYTSISGNEIMQTVAAQASSLAKKIIDNNPEKFRKILGNDYYEYVKRRGFNPEDILMVLNNDPNADASLLRIVEDAVKSSGVENWNDPEKEKYVRDWAKKGLWAAVGHDESQLIADWRRQTVLSNTLNKQSNLSLFNSSVDGKSYWYDSSKRLWYKDEGKGMEITGAPKDAPNYLKGNGLLEVSSTDGNHKYYYDSKNNAWYNVNYDSIERPIDVDPTFNIPDNNKNGNRNNEVKIKAKSPEAYILEGWTMKSITMKHKDNSWGNYKNGDKAKKIGVDSYFVGSNKRVDFRSIGQEDSGKAFGFAVDLNPTSFYYNREFFNLPLDEMDQDEFSEESNLTPLGKSVDESLKEMGYKEGLFDPNYVGKIMIVKTHTRAYNNSDFDYVIYTKAIQQ